MSNKSNIQEAYNLDQIFTEIKSADQSHLVIFDIDDVIITTSPDDDFRVPIRDNLLKSITSNLNPTEADLIHSIILASRKAILVDQNIIELFKLLLHKQIPTIALTGMGTGKFGVIESMEQFRNTELNKLGISFMQVSPFKQKNTVNLDLNKIKKSQI